MAQQQQPLPSITVQEEDNNGGSSTPVPPPSQLQQQQPARRPMAVRHGSCTIQRGFEPATPIRSRNRAATISAAEFAAHKRNNGGLPLASTAEEGDTAPRVVSTSAVPDGTGTGQDNSTTEETGSGGPLTWAKSLMPGSPSRRRAATTATPDQGGRGRAGSIASRLTNSSIALGYPGSRPNEVNNTSAPPGRDYDTRVHDLLDVIDPEVQVLNTLGDLQNTLFIPSGFGFFDRTRKVQLTKPPYADIEEESAAEPQEKAKKRSSMAGLLSGKQPTQSDADLEAQRARAEEKELPRPPPPPTKVEQDGQVQDPPTPVDTEATVVADREVVKGKYFVLPSTLVDMSDWSQQEKEDLDDYVRHLMHSKKEIARRKWRGFKKYVKTPLGAFVTIYASLLTFWGAAWVLFLIGWIPAGDRQAYFVEICDQILVALFCVTGLGLIPWRIRDTYHTFFIVKYHRKTLKLRKARGLPKLVDDNDLPNDAAHNADIERAGHGEDAVLTDEEQAIFLHHQLSLQKAHSYYRPHETMTHHAFPIKILITIIVLCDMHSTFQLALGSATWSISYHRDFKKILTTIILCFSLTCNISGGIWIAIGNRKTRKVEVVEALMRQAITAEALKRKEDAEAYRAEKREEREKELRRAREKELERRWNHSDDGGFPRTASLPLKTERGAPGLFRRGSDPGSIVDQEKTATSRQNRKSSGRLGRSASEKRLITKHGSSASSTTS